MADLFVCAIFKNEAPYIYEWLSFHAFIGVKHFFLYDNGSDDNSRDIISSWPNQSMITVIDWPGSGMQIHAYNNMLEKHRDRDEWCAFIDCDEFLTPQGGVRLPEILDFFEPRCNALFVHWLMFGSSGQIEPTSGLVTERFVRRSLNSFPPNNVGKTIVKLNKAKTIRTCHVVQCEGAMMSDDGEEIDQEFYGIHSKSSHNNIALNHYFTKSLSEWHQRRAIGKADKRPSDADYKRSEEEFHRHDHNQVEDLKAYEIAQRAKEIYYLNNTYDI